MIDRRMGQTIAFLFVLCAAVAGPRAAFSQAAQTPATSPAPTEAMSPPQPMSVEQSTPATTIPSPTPEKPSVATDVEATEAGPAISTARADIPHDLSPMGMFLAADWVVKSVMISLAFASLVTWTVWLAKSLQMAGARGRATGALKRIGSARTLDAALQAVGKRRGVVPTMLQAAHEELRYSDAAIDHSGNSGAKERVGSALSRIEIRAGRRMAKGTGVLATIGSTAPFVGLFGTVWGIMNSFIGISESNTTNLAVVAPGIAEALLATAIGLVAAIPAVIIYNVFARSITGYRQLLGDAAAEIERLVSRDLDFRKVPGTAAAAKIKLVTE
ncbi:tonB-system energizer ExbB [Ciceribacter sp. L1K23]|uniref:tonB-system energizer ExbB n=1 Tax=Ciceribacter sp. L1K23 TaxID=2820276 RepID=UPI001B84232E|nr:tonB-system energizer ExbB [Ciceribacter sp. L1K23]MBR0557777.1 tonB-system energizer ExbB [Ciceribacter sp. L1K23]